MVPHPDPNRALAAARDAEYTHRVWYLVSSFIFLVAVFQLGSLLLTKLFASRRTSSDVEHNGPVSGRAVSLKRLPLALVNYYRIVAFRLTFTIGSYSLNLAEVFVTIAYIVALYVLEFVDTRSISGENLSVTYWVKRAGAIGVSQLPLVTALGSKNNIVGLITGISYEKLNYMHRMSARVVITLLWVHAGTMLKQSKPGFLKSEFDDYGLTAAVAIAVLIVVSLRPVRAAAYELFVVIHLVTVVLFLAFGYLHAKVPGYHHYIWPCFLIWGLDRFIRVVRLIAFNHSYFGFTSGSGTMDATVELLSPNFVRLRLRRPAHFHWKPGQSAFLTMPGVSNLPFESHPFTIVSVDKAHDPNIEQHEKDLSVTKPYWKELVFFIGVQEGFTKKLGELAVNGGTVKTFIDGPYGHSPDLSIYDTSVLIAGGSGISFALPLFLDTIAKVTQGMSNTKRLVFIWAVRDANHLLWISDTLSEALKFAPATLSISIRIFITSNDALSAVRQWDENSETYETDSDKEKSRPTSLLGDPAVNVTCGFRPDFNKLLQEEADTTNGRMSVSICGSQSVARGVKHALGFSVAGPTRILKGGASITLHVEAFGYA